MSSFEYEVSVVLPCRNEQDAISACIQEIQEVFAANGIVGEVIVSDSSWDDSPQIARKLGAQVVKHDFWGYGNAYRFGIQAARGEYLFLADADGTYSFRDIPLFLQTLKSGADIVLGNRISGEMMDGAMPRLHLHVGSPLFSWLFRFLFNLKIRDIHSGVRASRRSTLLQLNLRSEGMEFASEMLIAAGKKKLKIVEIPVSYKVRIGVSKLRTFADGFRHLGLMLMYWSRAETLFRR